ncbi:MAG: YggS family pyridoxal phosphate-dependent enzyme [Candidatus Omnitrophica bacterium]|jgi:hypothetical protein|nr:YggS family pyridoxal phosphate-dependent enzyme [Candidatus Omnitrophota bacterium]
MYNGLADVSFRVGQACLKANRDPSEITIVAVAKGRSAQEIQEVLQQGISDIGENKVQEAVLKFNQLSAICHLPFAIKWHMIGHLQTNKVKDAVRIFDLIHSVDSLRLAEEIDRQAAKINKVQQILLQIKTSPEETKFGLSPDDAVLVIKQIASLKNIKLKGLMTIAPLVSAPEEARPYFRQLRELRDKIYSLKLTAYSLQLSMGMSDDFEIAIEEAATIIRLGRAIFER